MADGKARTMLAIALIFVMSALMGLQSVSGAGIGLPTVEQPAGAAEELPLPDGVDAGANFQAPIHYSSFSERLAAAGSVGQLVAESPDGWVPVAPGVDYQLFVLGDPNNVHVARMDRANLGLFLETGIAQGRLSGGVERTSAMFSRYDGAINYWGSSWGKTNDVLVAINGSFFDSSGVPDRGMVQSGWYAKRFTDNENGSGFVWKMDRSAFIGECVYHQPSNQFMTYLKSGLTEKFQGINRARGTDEFVIYTAQYDKSTLTDASGVEIVVELTRPMLIIPPSPGNYVVGTVRQIRDLKGNTAIPFDHIILSATGTMRTKLLANLAVGDQIALNNSLTTYEDDCQTPLAVDFTKAYAALGGSYYFLSNGVIQTFTDPGAVAANPRTAIAYNGSYIFFIVVDGRDPGISVGMTIAQLASFAKNTLGATYGINQDGGGSSTMVIDGVVVNTPSDLTPVACPFTIYLPTIQNSPMDGPQPVVAQEETPELPPCYVHTERAVSNSMMMVAALPMDVSGAFSVGQQVSVPVQTSVYLGPGSNYAVLGTVGAGESGDIAPNAAGLSGVYAKGQYWWLVDFNNIDGWVPESALVGVP